MTKMGVEIYLGMKWRKCLKTCTGKTFTTLLKLKGTYYGIIFTANVFNLWFLRSVLAEVRKIEKGGSFTIQKFVEFAKYHQNMLFPAFQLQLNLQTKVIGTKFWKKCSQRRIEISKGKFVTLVQLMELVMCLLRHLAKSYLTTLF
jgi:hypothetical protein